MDAQHPPSMPTPITAGGLFHIYLMGPGGPQTCGIFHNLRGRAGQMKGLSEIIGVTLLQNGEQRRRRIPVQVCNSPAQIGPILLREVGVTQTSRACVAVELDLSHFSPV